MSLDKRKKIKRKFENRCQKLIVMAYQTALEKKIIQLDWNENDITLELHRYIEVNPLKRKWRITTSREYHLFKNDVKKEKGFADKLPRIDLRLVTWSRSNELDYFMEAKNLEQDSSALKRRYIKTGIDNFTSKKYENGCLVGYLLSGNLKLTIDGINSLLIKDERSSEVLIVKPSKIYENYYESQHKEIGILKHLMFDFTEKE